MLTGSAVMEVDLNMVTPEGRLDVKRLVDMLEADGYTILSVVRTGEGVTERCRIQARWPTHAMLGGRTGVA